MFRILWRCVAKIDLKALNYIGSFRTVHVNCEDYYLLMTIYVQCGKTFCLVNTNWNSHWNILFSSAPSLKYETKICFPAKKKKKNHQTFSRAAAAKIASNQLEMAWKTRPKLRIFFLQSTTFTKNHFCPNIYIYINACRSSYIYRVCGYALQIGWFWTKGIYITRGESYIFAYLSNFSFDPQRRFGRTGKPRT